jgi:hypothetical protein
VFTGPLHRLAVVFAMSVVLWALPASAQTPTPSPSPTTSPTRTRTPTGTPTTTPTVTATPTASGTSAPAPTATSLFSAARATLNGGVATVIKSSDSFGLSGETVDAGHFEVLNTTDDVETVNEVIIEATDEQVVSSFSLTGRDPNGGQQVVTSSPFAVNFFFFDPGLAIGPGETASFSLSATIAASNTGGNGTPTPESFQTITPSPTPTDFGFGAKRSERVKIIAATMLPTQPASFPFGTLALGLALVGVVSAARGDRRGVLAALSLLALVAVAWAGGLSGCSTEQSTEQTVTRVTGRGLTNPVRFDGVPASLGHVARPLPLVFPGQAGSIVGTLTPSQ